MPKTLTDVLAALHEVEGTGLAKQASAPVNPAAPNTQKVASAKAELVKAVRDAVPAPQAGSEKTASAQSPAAVETLLKTASALAGAEEKALMKTAQLYGVAVADAFVSRLRQHGMVAEKVAAASPQSGASGDSIKLAMEQGYADGLKAVEQVKQAMVAEAGQDPEKVASFKQGYADTAQELTKLANDCYTKGYQNTIQVLQHIAG